MTDVADAKRGLRVQAAEARRLAHDRDRDGHAGIAVRDHFMAAVKLPPGSIVGGYWPMGTELDVRPLMIALHERGHVCALPVAQRRQPLTFHIWQPHDKLVAGVFGILMPDHHTPTVVPDVLLVPLLAFDAAGMRIGYGGGYIDRTIPEIRRRKDLLTVGIAYAAQQVAKVPADPFDQRLDWVVTEAGARRMERRRFPWLRKFLNS
jgi:5-formyltetrahydrofolate cyclo-ligase